MKQILTWLLTAMLAMGGFSLTSVAQADVSCTGNCLNAEDGDNDSSTDQSGTSASGDAVAGQVVGVVSAGDTSVDATNHSEDVDVSTGDTTAANDAAAFTGQSALGTTTISVADVDVSTGAQAQDGDNSTDVVQAAEATSGDGVGGSVIGVVTSAGGSADVVAANTSENIDIETGGGDAANGLASFVGQAPETVSVSATDVTVVSVINAQDGDNDLSADQSASATSGDGVGGQVLGIVSAGDASVDATNESTDVDLSTGDADASSDTATRVGQGSFTTTITAADVTAIGGFVDNAQDGDNSEELSQDALASTGDAVGGQVAGVVTSAGGSADVVAANTSEDVDVETGDGDAANELASFVGQLDGTTTITADVIGPSFLNAQDGDNDLSADQSASAASGDGVGGQVLGIVSAGDASVDATNESTDVDLSTGDGDASNDFAAFVGQVSRGTTNVSAADVTVGSAVNAQDGDNSKDLSQDASASTGDAVGGQVAGVVTSAGGSADLVLANTSEDVDGDTGDSEFNNADEEFVGQNFGELFIGTPVEAGLQP